MLQVTTRWASLCSKPVKPGHPAEHSPGIPRSTVEPRSILLQKTPSPQLVSGSSVAGWLATLQAVARLRGRLPASFAYRLLRALSGDRRIAPHWERYQWRTVDYFVLVA